LDFTYKILLDYGWIGQSLKNLGPDLDCKVWQSGHICSLYSRVGGGSGMTKSTPAGFCFVCRTRNLKFVKIGPEAIFHFRQQQESAWSL